MPFRRSGLAALLPMFASILCGSAQASGDGCEPGWTLNFAARPECANIAGLVPGNDTRANLLLLLADRHGVAATAMAAPQPLLTWPDFRLRFSGLAADDAGAYALGEGSRCRSDASGIMAFSTAVEASTNLSPDERNALLAARANLKPQCTGDAKAAGAPAAAADPMPQVTSPEGRAFVTYLRAAEAFYAGRFDEATTGFAQLRTNPDPWLSDTAAYMAARTAVNRLQISAFDDYGTFKGSAVIDQAAAHEAAASLDTYVKDHAGGRYVVSARGLQRRVAWLAGWTEDLASRYAALIAQPVASRGLDDAALADEIDNKLLPTLTPSMTPDPVLLATLDLKALRRASPDTPPTPLPDLAAQRDAFVATPELYAYLQAAAAYYGGDARFVIKAIPDDTRRRGGDHLWFSRQLLRGLALEAVGDRNARGFWKELLPGATRPLDGLTIQLALALNDERRGDLADVFEAGSPVNDPAIRAILLTHDAGPALLRTRADDVTAAARERRIALFTLLIKDLTQGAYADFLADVARVPADAPTLGPVVIEPLGDGDVPLGLFIKGETAGDIGCPALAVTAADLVKDPKAVRDRLCLAEWLRLNGFDPDPYAQQPSRDELGAGPSGFPGTVVTRATIYRAIMAEPAVPPDDRAYTLYRAVKCYEPSGYNRCGGPEAPKPERRRWHDTLKRDYPGSRWAKQLAYWW